ncbi:hypothetical protein ACFL5Q_05615 [Planctomycetota bacterium]
MNCMDENPYQSPRSFQEAEKPPKKPPNRYVNAVLNGVMTFWACVMVQITVREVVADYSIPEKQAMLPIFALVALPVGVWIAWWTLRVPESKRVFPVAVLVGVSPWVLGLIGVFFFW